ncbi:Spy/CpxP family protein refolding chaperone [Nitrospiraceae bacterium AH_259_D15_M11_P09]|nr:Spy/CpxP family protein refolding chaperone [Nitrospiraceae bacterium AH_259_D15_M11_P09]
MKFNNIPKASFWVLALVIGSALTFLSQTPGWADSRGHGYGHGKRHDAAKFIRHALMAKEELGITDEQATRLRAMKIAFKKERISRKAEVDLAKVDLHALLHGDQATMAQIEAAVNKVYTLKAGLRVASIKARREAKAVLTPEQQKKMKAMHRHRMREMGREHQRERGHR